MIKQNTPYKIALVGDCLASGGAEKVHAALSLYFKQQGLDVHNCILMDWVAYDFAGPLLNLGKIHPTGNAITRKFTRFKALRHFIVSNSFDCVIDFRMHTNPVLELLLSKWVYPENTFFTVHHALLAYYFPKPDFLSRLIYSGRKIITVSKAIAVQVKKQKLAKDVQCIYNPFNLKAAAETKVPAPAYRYIISAGRMNNGIKQFDKLIATYATSQLPGNNIKLMLLGEGENKATYEKQAEAIGLKDMIVFKGFVQNPLPFFSNALFLVLSSSNEGFGNVLVEALACGTPVVSFDCQSGPNEIISHRENGLLIVDQDFGKLQEAMEEMAFDEKLYYHCKENAMASVKRFDIEQIGAQWMETIKRKS